MFLGQSLNLRRLIYSLPLNPPPSGQIVRRKATVRIPNVEVVLVDEMIPFGLASENVKRMTPWSGFIGRFGSLRSERFGFVLYTGYSLEKHNHLETYSSDS